MNGRVGEINVICTDLERSLTFYHDVLGFEVTGEEGIAVHLRCGDQPFLLLPVAREPLPPTPYCSRPAYSFDFMVDRIDEAVAHLHAHSVAFESEWTPGDSHVFVRDPDGLVIEVIEVSPSRA